MAVQIKSYFEAVFGKKAWAIGGGKVQKQVPYLLNTPSDRTSSLGFQKIISLRLASYGQFRLI